MRPGLSTDHHWSSWLPKAYDFTYLYLVLGWGRVRLPTPISSAILRFCRYINRNSSTGHKTTFRNMEIGRNRSESRLKKQPVKVGGVEHFIMWILKLGGQEVRLQTGRGV